jgi:hypothetical protein
MFMCNKLRTTKWIFMKFDTVEFCYNESAYFIFDKNLTVLKCVIKMQFCLYRSQKHMNFLNICENKNCFEQMKMKLFPTSCTVFKERKKKIILWYLQALIESTVELLHYVIICMKWLSYRHESKEE